MEVMTDEKIEEACRLLVAYEIAMLDKYMEQIEHQTGERVDHTRDEEYIQKALHKYV